MYSQKQKCICTVGYRLSLTTASKQATSEVVVAGRHKPEICVGFKNCIILRYKINTTFDLNGGLLLNYCK